MQRKNSILRSKSHRDAVAMISAIIALVVIASIMTLSLNLSIKTSKKTTDLYLYEQAVLLSQSAAEYAMLKISQQDQCSVDSLNFSYNNTFDIKITIKYIFTNPSLCATNSLNDGSNYATVTYANSNGSILMDIVITTKQNIAIEPIRYFVRSIQKL